jgi:hypothetical protein
VCGSSSGSSNSGAGAASDVSFSDESQPGPLVLLSQGGKTGVATQKPQALALVCMACWQPLHPLSLQARRDGNSRANDYFVNENKWQFG